MITIRENRYLRGAGGSVAGKEKSRTNRNGEVERDYETYKTLLGLWQSENPIKTLKLQVLLAVNALLVAAVAVAGGLRRELWYVYAAGLIFSLIWAFSLGRTSLFQDVWQARLTELHARHPGDPRFSVLENTRARRRARPLVRIAGGIPSRWYLILSPLVFSAAWLALWIVAALQG